MENYEYYEQLINEYKIYIDSYFKTKNKRIKSGEVFVIIPKSYNKNHTSIKDFFNYIDNSCKLNFIDILHPYIKFPFVIFIPNNITKKHIILHGNNCAKEEGNPINVITGIEELTDIAGYNLINENAVLLVPITSNYLKNNSKEFFPMQASRNVVFSKKGIYTDLFKQINSMIRYTRNFLKEKYNFILMKKIIAHGFSSSSKFVLRYASLYPENVNLLIAGGYAAQNILPLKSITINNEKINLPYPIGIYNINKIRKQKRFDYKKYFQDFLNMKQFYYMGELEDKKSETAFSKIHTDMDLQEIYLKVFGDKMLPIQGTPNRFEEIKKIISDLNLTNIEFKLYKNVSHTPIPAKRKIKQLLNS